MPELITYEALRPTLTTGDIVTWLGADMLSRAIEHYRPGGSHTSMVVVEHGHVFLVEALAHGPSLRLASARFSNYNGDIFIHRIPTTPSQEECLATNALVFVGEDPGYGFLTLFKLAWGKVRNVMTTPVCSQTAAYFLAEQGLIPPQCNVVSPGELAALLPAPVRLAPYTQMAD